MGTVVSKSQPRKNKIRQNAILVGTLQVSAQRSSEHRPPVIATPRTASYENLKTDTDDEVTKPISLVDSYEVNDSLLFHSRSNTGGAGEDFVPYFKAWLTRVEAEELCSICKTFNGKKVFPCRVCTRVFHEGCLQKTRKLNDNASKEAFSRSETDIGWSCHYCEYITLLLSDDEMRNIIEYFDQFDINQDTQIQKDEYFKIRKLSFERLNPAEVMSNDVKSDVEREFKVMDRNNTGTIDWWEFVNYEAVKVLGRRDKASLAILLSKREIEQARDMFHSYDRDEDGYINGHEAMSALGRWFGHLKIPSDNSAVWNRNSTYLKHEEKNGHINTHMQILMDADMDKNRLISWHEYLRDQALYLLAARPNYFIPTNRQKKMNSIQ